MCKLWHIDHTVHEDNSSWGSKNILLFFYVTWSVNEVNLHIFISWFVPQVLLLVYLDDSREFDQVSWVCGL